jgi:hypothetical protein
MKKKKRRGDYTSTHRVCYLLSPPSLNTNPPPNCAGKIKGKREERRENRREREGRKRRKTYIPTGVRPE